MEMFVLKALCPLLSWQIGKALKGLAWLQEFQEATKVLGFPPGAITSVGVRK